MASIDVSPSATDVIYALTKNCTNMTDRWSVCSGCENCVNGRVLNDRGLDLVALVMKHFAIRLEAK